MVIQPFLCAVNWGVVGWVLVGTIALLVVVAAIGRAIAAAFPPNPEHVSSFRKPVAAPVPVAPVAVAPVAPAPAPVPAAAPAPAGAIPPEVMAVIAASVAVVLRGQRFSITGVEPAQKPADIERLMSLWSLEGRRQVYSSHSLPR
ncbi:MAG: hypothetical protein IJN19_00470 [Opitutales bacterium]|nr:hypothetical protein [Opitutales bacterium]